MDYVRVRADEACDDCGRKLWNISHFDACPRCKKITCCNSSSHHTEGSCYEQWVKGKTDVVGPYFR